MKGHIKLNDEDFILTRRKGSGYYYKEKNIIPETLKQIYFQNGCLPYGEENLIFIQNDFAGGDQQVSYNIRNMINQSLGIKLYGNRLPEYDERIHGNYILDTSVSQMIFTSTELLPSTKLLDVIPHKENVYFRFENKEIYCIGNSISKLTGFYNGLFKYKNNLYCIQGEGNNIKIKNLDTNTTHITNLTHITTSTFTSFLFPHLVTFENNDIRFLSPELLKGMLALELTKTDKTTFEVKNYFSTDGEEINTSITTKGNQGTIYKTISLPENRFPNFIKAQPINDITNNDYFTEPDCLIIEVINTADTYAKGFEEPKAQIPSKMLSLLGYDKISQNPCIEDYLHTRKNMSYNPDNEESWLNIGEYDASEPAVLNDEGDMIEDFYKMAQPFRYPCKIYFKSEKEFATYKIQSIPEIKVKTINYNFHVGESIDLYLLVKEYTDLLKEKDPEILEVNIKFPQHTLALEVPSMISPEQVLKPGDKYYIPIMPPNIHGVATKTLSDNIIPGSCKVKSEILNINAPHFPSISKSQVDLTSGINFKTEQAQVEFDKDLEYSTKGNAIITKNPLLGGRAPIDEINISYRKYDNNSPLTPNFIPHEFIRRKIYLNSIISENKIRDNKGYQIITNNENHIFIKNLFPINSENPENSLKANAGIYQDEDDYIMKKVYEGNVTVTQVTKNKLLFATKTEIEAILYIIDRTSITELIRIPDAEIFSIGFLNNIILYALKKNDIIQIYSYPNNKVFEINDYHNTSSYASGYFYNRETDVLFISNNLAISISNDGTYVETKNTALTCFNTFYNNENYYCFKNEKTNTVLHRLTKSQYQTIAFQTCIWQMGNDGGALKIFEGIKIDTPIYFSEYKNHIKVEIRKEPTDYKESEWIELECNETNKMFTFADNDTFSDKTQTFSWIQIKVSTKEEKDLKEISGIGVVFQLSPELLETTWEFEISISRAQKWLENKDSQTYATIENHFKNLTDSIKFIDIEGQEHNVRLKSAEIAGQPTIRSKNQYINEFGEVIPINERNDEQRAGDYTVLIKIVKIKN